MALALSMLVVIAISLVVASAARAEGAFGIEHFDTAITADQGGTPATQAGSHPYAVTTTLIFNHREEEGELFVDGGNLKNLEANLPRGLVFNPEATSVKCTEAELDHNGGCPNAAAVGAATVVANGIKEMRAAVFNMVPPPGVPAALAFNIAGLGFVVHLAGRVRTGEDYGLSANAASVSEQVGVSIAKVTLWGDPSANSHDKERGQCLGTSGESKVFEEELELEEEITAKGHPNPNRSYFCAVPPGSKPFITMPTACGGELLTSIRLDSWQEPATYLDASSRSAAVTGCDVLDFSPKLTVQPSSSATESPTGLSVTLRMPQPESLEGLAETHLRNATVVLPQGVAVSPSAANGLSACTADQIALTSPSPPTCPDSAKIGVVEVVTPLLAKPLQGAVYIAKQGENPFGSLLALYVTAEGSGAVVKLAGHVEADAVTGQLTTTFTDLPQLPFSELSMRFMDGPRAPLISPSVCGTYATTSALIPWSRSEAITASDPFPVNTGCGSAGFSPTFLAGALNNQAGNYSPFSLTLTRQDGEQRLGSLNLQMPPGLLGAIKNVPLCPDGLASQGTCGPQSLIGHTTDGAGPGPNPVFVGGDVFLTGPYNGAPFGLSIVVHAVAGPFDLGTVVVRGAVRIDPDTAQVSIRTDPLPTILQGIPLDVRTVNVLIDRPQFILNPTNCSPLWVSGVVGATGGTTVAVSSKFTAANCAALSFKPDFKATTAAKTSKAAGASLRVNVSVPAGHANIQKVKVDLPRQLPSRLTTLQKACRDSVFKANPAECPTAAFVGVARARTPLLANPLTGPAILVSHGAASFPDLVIVLQGEGITLNLDGKTDIKRGITSNTFNSVPDAPVGAFELNVPEGPHSVLAAFLPPSARSSMCKQKLLMPTTITAQNGAVVTQTTKVGVSGCSKRKTSLRKRQSRRMQG